MKRIALGVCVWLCWGIALAQEVADERAYEQIKLDVLCRTMRFVVGELYQPDSVRFLACGTLSTLENSLRPTHTKAVFLFKMFRNKQYLSYGKGKVDARLEKLTKDISTELSKLDRRREWQELSQAFVVQLAETKNENLRRVLSQQALLPLEANTAAQDSTLQTATESRDVPKDSPSNVQTTQANKTNMFFYFFLLILLIGGVAAYLIQQLRKIQEQIAALDEDNQAKFSELEDTLHKMTPLTDTADVLTRINFLADQIVALSQEVQTLKQRNEYKPSAMELLAKRTEHLEKVNLNPNVQMYYAKYRPDLNGFNPHDFRTEPTRDSIYKVEIDLHKPQEAVFSLIDRSEFHYIPLRNVATMLAPVCDYADEPYNDTRIINIEPGRIAHQGDGVWRVVKKAKIAFE